ncbi:MAG: hypothetical protein AB7V50_11030, partial [Vampirovibrionia bacterium]
MLRKIRKNKFRTLQSSFLTNISKVLSVLTLAYTVSLTPVFAQEIVPDNKSNTVLNGFNNTSNIYSNTIKGANAFNSFIKFNVCNGIIVYFMVPEGC